MYSVRGGVAVIYMEILKIKTPHTTAERLSDTSIKWTLFKISLQYSLMEYVSDY